MYALITLAAWLLPVTATGVACNTAIWWLVSDRTPSARVRAFWRHHLIVGGVLATTEEVPDAKA